MGRAIVAVISLVVVAGAALAVDVRTNLGTLTCSTMPAARQAERSSADTAVLQCVFKAAGSANEERYSGAISELGAGKSFDTKHVLVWTVMGPATAQLEPGLLAQRYVSGTPGGASNATAPRVLVGQRAADIMLQQETSGPGGEDTAVTVLDLKLSLTPA